MGTLPPVRFTMVYLCGLVTPLKGLSGANGLASVSGLVFGGVCLYAVLSRCSPGTLGVLCAGWMIHDDG